MSKWPSRHLTTRGLITSVKFPVRASARNKNPEIAPDFGSDSRCGKGLNIFQVPPLRERLADQPRELERLAAVLLERMAGAAGRNLLDQAMTALERLPPRNPWPGNVRELEQALRRIILNGSYTPQVTSESTPSPWQQSAAEGRLTAGELLGNYCRQLHGRLGTYEAVANQTQLDRRTVKKYIDQVSESSVEVDEKTR